MLSEVLVRESCHKSFGTTFREWQRAAWPEHLFIQLTFTPSLRCPWPYSEQRQLNRTLCRLSGNSKSSDSTCVQIVKGRGEGGAGQCGEYSSASRIPGQDTNS